MWAREGLSDVGHSGTLLLTSVAMKILAKVSKMTFGCGLQSTGMRRSISQTDSLSTTVPINLAQNKFKQRHYPTRRSLHRSRLHGLNLITERNAHPDTKYFKVLILLVSTQLLIGMIFSAVVYYTTTVTPSLKYKDLPYWASAPIGISGIVGIIYVCRFHRQRPWTKHSLSMKVLSFVLSGASIILCACAVAFLSFHLMTFRHSEGCTTSTNSDTGQVSCICRRPHGQEGHLSRRQEYQLISCPDVLTLVKFLFICMCILGCLGGLAAFIYDLLLWTSRYKHVYIQSELPEPTEINAK